METFEFKRLAVAPSDSGKLLSGKTPTSIHSGPNSAFGLNSNNNVELLDNHCQLDV